MLPSTGMWPMPGTRVRLGPPGLNPAGYFPLREYTEPAQRHERSDHRAGINDRQGNRENSCKCVFHLRLMRDRVRLLERDRIELQILAFGERQVEEGCRIDCNLAANTAPGDVAELADLAGNALPNLVHQRRCRLFVGQGCRDLFEHRDIRQDTTRAGHRSSELL